MRYDVHVTAQNSMVSTTRVDLTNNWITIVLKQHGTSSFLHINDPDGKRVPLMTFFVTSFVSRSYLGGTSAAEYVTLEH